MTGGRVLRPVRVVIDANTFVSAAIAGAQSPPGAFAALVDRALAGPTEVIVCPRLLDEVEDVLYRPKLARYVPAGDVPKIMGWILGGSILAPDPDSVERHCRDPKDDYIVALARDHGAAIVTGDDDLKSLGGQIPVVIMTPRQFLDTLE